MPIKTRWPKLPILIGRYFCDKKAFNILLTMRLFPYFSSLIIDFVRGNKPDLSFGLIEELGAKKDLAANSWDSFEKKVERLTDENLTRFLDGLCLSGNHDKAVRKYISSGTSPTRNLVSGAYNLHVAWLKRGTGWGSSLSPTQINQFTGHLEKAEDDLTVSYANPIYEAEAKARLIRVKMGMSEGREAQEVFHYVLSLNPNHLLAYINYFKVASPKWLGDAEILRELAVTNGDKNLSILLKLMYIFELFSDKYYNSHKDAKINYENAKDELFSLLLIEAKPIQDDTLLAIYNNNYLACFYRIHHMPLKEFMMNKFLMGRRTIYPWAYFG